MGISVGWGDRYGYTLAFQWIDITGLTPGRYQIFGTVDAQNYYLESNETNNTTWAILQLNGDNTREVDPAGPARLRSGRAAELASRAADEAAGSPSRASLLSRRR